MSKVIYNGIKLEHACQIIDVPYMGRERKPTKKDNHNKLNYEYNDKLDDKLDDKINDKLGDESDDEHIVKKEKDNKMTKEIAENNYNIMTDEGRFTAFWKLIDTFEWKLKSDGVLEKNDITKITDKWDLFNEIIFMNIYPIVIKNIEDVLQNQLNEKKLNKQKKHDAVGHIIAMGQHWYNNIIETPDLAEFLLLDDEMQNFHSNLPKKLLEKFDN